MIHITSTDGRIGPFWWINSNTTARQLDIFKPLQIRAILWGTVGIGRDLRMDWEAVE